jgi:hypothetical protein
VFKNRLEKSANLFCFDFGIIALGRIGKTFAGVKTYFNSYKEKL